jgi:hypothetical protein
VPATYKEQKFERVVGFSGIGTWRSGEPNPRVLALCTSEQSHILATGAARARPPQFRALHEVETVRDDADVAELQPPLRVLGQLEEVRIEGRLAAL